MKLMVSSTLILVQIIHNFFFYFTAMQRKLNYKKLVKLVSNFVYVK